MVAIYLAFLGCKLNQAEIDALARAIRAHGHRVVDDPALADWAVVNTCTVTHIAARKSRRLVRHLRRRNPDLRVAVTGCYAHMSPGDLEAIEGVDLLVSNREKEEVLPRILERVEKEGLAAVANAEPCAEEGCPGLATGRTRAFIKIQDGCDNRCTYCIVTVARGPARSVPPERVLAEVRHRLAEGHQELVLTGINIGGYGRDRALPRAMQGEDWSLARLARRILSETAVPRLRLSSIEPWDVTPELLALWEDERLCRHIHLPLQSGSDAVLRRMGRHYSTAQFRRIVEAIRERIPDVSLTTDVMVGFPGETEAEHAASRAFVEAMAFGRLHVFKYSCRPGTRAAEMPGQVHPQVAQARSGDLIALGQRLSGTYHRRFVGRTLEVLFEAAEPDHEGPAPLWNGLSDNYIRIEAPSQRDLCNELLPVHCLEADAEGIRGTLADAG